MQVRLLHSANPARTATLDASQLGTQGVKLSEADAKLVSGDFGITSYDEFDNRAIRALFDQLDQRVKFLRKPEPVLVVFGEAAR